jgi:GTP-binding protein HflX
VDVSNPNWELQHSAVIETLETLGASDKPILTAFNKADLVDDPFLRRRLLGEWPNSVVISAKSGDGMDNLMEAIIRIVKSLLTFVKALVPYSEASLVQDCYNYGRVINTEYRDEGIYLEAELVSEMFAKMAKYAVE